MPENYPANQLLPVEKEHNNFTFTAPKNMPECNDLRVTKGPYGIHCVFKCHSQEQRHKFLREGEITLCISSDVMPPVALMVGDINE